MQFIALIYSTEGADDVEMDVLLDQYRAFGEAATEAGVMIAGEPLEPVSTATSVRLRDGNTQLTDGPFAETKEQLGGFYLLECKDLDEATHWAAQIPSARYGTIEVRPIMAFE
ncbi:MAG: YciI family protein [Pseudomonadota bacterium]